MSTSTKNPTSLLAEQFAEIYQMSQEEFRDLIAALRDESVDLHDFVIRVNAYTEILISLKKIRIQLRSEREELGLVESRA